MHNRMNKNLYFIAYAAVFVFISVSSSASTYEEFESFSLKIKNKQLYANAKNASVRNILKELENKSGIKVHIVGGVPKRNVSLNINALPLSSVGTLLSKMSLKNYSVVYDQTLSVLAIYILPQGHDISTYIKDKTVISQVSFIEDENTTYVKNNEIVTKDFSENKMPIRYIKDEVLLKFHLGVSKQEINEILKKHNLEKVGVSNSLKKIGYVKVRIPDERDLISVIKEMRKEYKLKLPEPNYIANVLTVNDALYKKQWYISNTKFDQVWSKFTKNEFVKVALIDSGIATDQPDLQGQVLNGYDFVNRDDDPTDDNGHGTFVAGIIAANSNNIGIKGLYEFAQIIPVKVIDENGFGTYEDTASGIIYAVDNGAKIINLSIGGYGYSLLLQDAIDYAFEKGCIIVAAGGNDGVEQKIYPAAYPNVIGVAALNSDGQVWSSSNSGRHIDVSAPGENILSTGLDGNYIYASGTSGSAAIVSALAAMLVSEKPDLSSFFIERLIIQSSEAIEEIDKKFRNGKINALAALNQQVKPFHDVAIESVNLESLINEKDKEGFIEVGIKNRGSYPSETTKINVYVNEKLIAKDIDIAVSDKTVITVPWEFAISENNVVKIKAVVSPIKGEVTYENNEKIRVLEYSKIDSNIFILHKVDPGVHQWIAGEAFWEWPNNTSHEIYEYIGSPIYGRTYNDFDGNPRYTTNNYSHGKEIIYGSKAEDECDNPFGECSGLNAPYFRHFWNRGAEDGWDDGGYSWYDSAVNRAYKYWTGGYGLDGSYDSDWGNNGVQGQGVEYLYKNNQKSKAYEYLGHIVHLLTDMSVPAHVLNDGHPPGNDDNFEEYMRMYNWSVANNFVYKRYGDNGNEKVTDTVPSYSGYNGLYNIFYNMAEKADDFESDGTDGGSDDNPSHNNGHADGPLGDLTWDECSVHQAILEPYAIKQVAALYKWFWNETHTPPSKSTNPSPSNAATGLSINTNISWSNGGGATSYDVYFGTSSSPGSGDFKGNQTLSTYNPGTLSYTTTYYWRIDARNSDGTTIGDVWRFTTGSAPAYQISYNANGATSGSVPSSQTKTHDVPLTLRTNTGNLARTGYTFAGWNTSSNGTGTHYAAGGTYTVNAFDVLYAEWTAIPTYQISYNANGATSGSVPSSQTKTHDVPLTLRTNTGNLARTGYTFAGWNTSSNGTGTHYAAGGTYTVNAFDVLYAEWTAIPTYQISYNANGATSGSVPSSQTKTHDVPLTLRTNTGNLARTGYTFAGWNTSSNGTGTHYAAGGTYTVNAFDVLYAEWTAIPTINITPNTLSRSIIQGTNAPSQSFNVNNSGLGTLSYSISDNAAWLSCTPTSGTSTSETDTITVIYSTSGLSAGAYSATITISASGASNTPQTIPVSLTVTVDSGSLQVTISPVAAVSDGAQWRVDGGNWQNNGITVSGWAAGSHTVEFKEITGWTPPKPLSVSIDEGQTTNASGSYTQGDKFGLNLIISGSGVVNRNPNSDTYDSGTEVELLALPNAGWVFSQWSGDLISTDNPATIAINSEVDITATFLEDSDNDGISDEEENSGPNAGDGNKDGTPDSQQSNVSSLLTYDEQYFVTLEAPSDTMITYCQATDNPSPGDAPSNVEFPFGFFEFILEGIGVNGTLQRINNARAFLKYCDTILSSICHDRHIIFQRNDLPPIR
jgi:subtilisin family serine protease